MKILLIGGGLQGLSCGESLYKQHEVSIVAKDLMCRKSCFFKMVYMDVKADESLYPILEKERFDVLIPISDFTVPFISKNKEEIDDREEGYIERYIIKGRNRKIEKRIKSKYKNYIRKI